MKIDTRGKLCPEPIIMTKRAISDAKEGTRIEVVSDNETVRGNLLTYLRELGYTPECEAREGLFHITFVVGETESGESSTVDKERKENPKDEARILGKVEFLTMEDIKCAVSEKESIAVAISGDVMGSGDDKLGALLVRSFINSLAALDQLPSVIVLYNSGVKLTIEGSDTAQSLAELEKAGVEIIVCGTCTDFYAINDRVAVGTISNMLTITNKLAQADKIIYP